MSEGSVPRETMDLAVFRENREQGAINEKNPDITRGEDVVGSF